MSDRRRLLLVGGGHAHVEVIRRWRERPVPHTTLGVIDENLRPAYSGMIPGFVAGRYRRDELEIDLERLCDAPGVELVRDLAAAVDAEAGEIRLERGGVVRYHVASLDIGSTVASTDLRGVSTHALPARPTSSLLRGIEQLVDQATQPRQEPLRVHVIGGGAGGVELAFCLDSRLRREGAGPFAVTIVSRESRLLASGPPTLSRSLRRAADRRGIRIFADTRVSSLEEGLVRLDSGQELPTDAVLWVTGPASQPLGANSHLPVDARGFIEIEDTLQVRGQPDLFAVGDCASLPGMKKAGVYAVRAGPLLDDNLRARLEGRPLRRYQPQPNFLSLLNLGDGTALGTKWGWVVRGRLVMRLKDRIDRAFIAKYG